MTLYEEIEAKAKALEDEAAQLRAHLAAGGTWLTMEANLAEEWLKNLIVRIRPQAPTPPAPPAP
jgi:hypothetical protein